MVLKLPNSNCIPTLELHLPELPFIIAKFSPQSVDGAYGFCLGLLGVSFAGRGWIFIIFWIVLLVIRQRLSVKPALQKHTKYVFSTWAMSTVLKNMCLYLITASSESFPKGKETFMTWIDAVWQRGLKQLSKLRNTSLFLPQHLALCRSARGQCRN